MTLDLIREKQKEDERISEGEFNLLKNYDLGTTGWHIETINTIKETLNYGLKEINKDSIKINYLKTWIKKLKEGVDEESLSILINPNLFNEITEKEFDKKIVGEVETRKVIFLCAAGGRLVDNCQIASFNLLINDEAGAGKDYVTSKVLEILPEEVYIKKTRISPTAFTYWHNSKFEPDWTWDGKVFYCEDISEPVLNSDVFKVMCSSGSSATIVVNQRAIDISISGKPVIIATTASSTPNPELLRRFVILNLDSSMEQTKLIMKRHSQYRKKGIIPEYDKRYTKAMKYLKRVKVRIPYADLIDEAFPVENLIMRTNYPRFLDFISASAAFHQYQRKRDEEGYILAEKQDYEIARMCFLKLFSNKIMIPLTINQKKILEVFRSEHGLRGSLVSLLSKMNFLSIGALQTNLQTLARYGFLNTAKEKDDLNRDIVVYFLNEDYTSFAKIKIPSFDEILEKSSNNINFSEIEQIKIGEVKDG